MRTTRLLITVSCLALWALPASANDEVQKLIQDPNQWAIQTGDYANTRYSKLDQINAGNVGKLQAAWTFSTGVLRGHEGAPLVVGDVMYVSPHRFSRKAAGRSPKRRRRAQGSKRRRARRPVSFS